MAKAKQSISALLFGVAGLVLLDQLLKYYIEPLANSAVASGFLTWHLNPGISFGIELPFYISVSLMVFFISLLVVLFFVDKFKPTVYYWGLVLSIGGGIGNLVDRLTLGVVRDFVDVSWLPIFNLADVFVFIGVVCIVVGVLIPPVQPKT